MPGRGSLVAQKCQARIDGHYSIKNRIALKPKKSNQRDIMHFFKNNNAFGWLIAAIVLCLAVFTRLYGITEHGFHDGDEYAKHLFFTTDWYRQVLNDGVSGSLWARPSGHLFNNFLGRLVRIFCSSLCN